VNRSSHVFVPFENVLDRCRFCGNIESSHFSPSPIEVPQPTENNAINGHSPKVLEDMKMLVGAILDRIDVAPNDDPLPYVREYVDGIRKRLAEPAPIEAPQAEVALPDLSEDDEDRQKAKALYGLQNLDANGLRNVYRKLTASYYCRERQLLEALAQLSTLRERHESLDKVFKQCVYDHVKSEEKLFVDLGLNTREGRHFNERAEIAEAELVTLRERNNKLEEALRAICHAMKQEYSPATTLDDLIKAVEAADALL